MIEVSHLKRASTKERYLNRAGIHMNMLDFIVGSRSHVIGIVAIYLNSWLNTRYGGDSGTRTSAPSSVTECAAAKNKCEIGRANAVNDLPLLSMIP
jgi:hypothetical protein